MSCADCLSRRRFLAMAAGGAAVAISGCGDGVVSGVGPRVDVNNPTTTPNPFPPGNPGGQPGAELVIVVANFPELATTGQLVMIPDSLVAVKRTGTVTFEAYFIACTHAGCLTTLESNQFQCGCHGSRFDSSGNVLEGPANSPLDTFPTSYNPATDELTIN